MRMKILLCLLPFLIVVILRSFVLIEIFHFDILPCNFVVHTTNRRINNEYPLATKERTKERVKKGGVKYRYYVNDEFVRCIYNGSKC